MIKGNNEGFIEPTATRFKGFDNSMHLLGNCCIEFVGPDLALVETIGMQSYFACR